MFPVSPLLQSCHIPGQTNNVAQHRHLKPRLRQGETEGERERDRERESERETYRGSEGESERERGISADCMALKTQLCKVLATNGV